MLRNEIGRNERDSQADIMNRSHVPVARGHGVETHFETVVAEEPAVVVRVIVRDIHVMVDDDAMGDHQIVGLVAGCGILAVRDKCPCKEKHCQCGFSAHAMHLPYASVAQHLMESDRLEDLF